MASASPCQRDKKCSDALALGVLTMSLSLPDSVTPFDAAALFCGIATAASGILIRIFARFVVGRRGIGFGPSAFLYVVQDFSVGIGTCVIGLTALGPLLSEPWQPGETLPVYTPIVIASAAVSAFLWMAFASWIGSEGYKRIQNNDAVVCLSDHYLKAAGRPNWTEASERVARKLRRLDYNPKEVSRWISQHEMNRAD